MIALIFFFYDNFFSIITNFNTSMRLNLSEKYNVLHSKDCTYIIGFKFKIKSRFLYSLSKMKMTHKAQDGFKYKQ